MGKSKSRSAGGTDVSKAKRASTRPDIKWLTDDEAFAIFREVAAELDPDRPVWSQSIDKSLKDWLASPQSKPRLSLAGRVELKALAEYGFQRLFIVRYREEAERRNRLRRDLEEADQLLRSGDASGHTAQLKALEAMVAYAGETNASLEYLRKYLSGGRSLIESEFNGRLAGLIEVMSWRLGSARKAYNGVDRTAKEVIRLAESYATRAGITWGAKRIDAKEGAGKVRGVFNRVKKFRWQRLLDASVVDAADVADLREEQWFFLEVVRSGRFVESDKKKDLLKWCLERAKVYFDPGRLPPNAT